MYYNYNPRLQNINVSVALSRETNLWRKHNLGLKGLREIIFYAIFSC